MKVYRTTDNFRKSTTWKQWIKIGGCGLSDRARWEIVRPQRTWDNLLLDEILSESILADREIARFLVEHLNKSNMTYVEYEWPESILSL